MVPTPMFRAPCGKIFQSTMKNSLEQLAPGEDLEGKCAKSRGNGAGVEGDTDVVMKHLDAIGIEGTVKD